MFVPSKPDTSWSTIGLRVLIGSIVVAVALSIFDGFMKGVIFEDRMAQSMFLTMLAGWTVDFRYLAEQAVYAATIFFVGAKFFETRSMFTIGFDKLDAAKIAIKGPDDDNVVWIGHRYGTRLEAEVVANAFAERLKESATA
jgi:hypothetical protein